LTAPLHGSTFLSMEKRGVRGQKNRPRTYYGEAEAWLVLDWLNAKGGPNRQQARAEMERGIELILFMYKFAGRESSPEVQRAQRELNEWMLGYTSSNRLDCGESGLNWSRHVNADLPRVRVRGEAECVERVVELARMGVVGQVRKCQCGRYFFVRFPKREPPERFCTDECRVQFWEATEERKKQKRERARNNYQSRKELELGSRKAAHREGGKR